MPLWALLTSSAFWYVCTASCGRARSAIALANSIKDVTAKWVAPRCSKLSENKIK